MNGMWITRGIAPRSWPRSLYAIDVTRPLRLCGGGWRDTREGVRCDLAIGIGPGGRDYVGRHDVLVPAETVAAADRAGRLRAHRQVRRMSGVSRIRTAAARRPASREIRAWLCPGCGRSNHGNRKKCSGCGYERPTALHRAYLGAARAAYRDQPQAPSAGSPGAGAWDVSARCVKLRGLVSREDWPNPGPPQGGRGVPHRAGTLQAAPARLARAHRRPERRPVGLW